MDINSREKKQAQNVDLRRLKNPDLYLEFIHWMAAPRPLRKEQTQEEFAGRIGVGADTLSDWKKRDGFWERVMNEVREWGREKTPNVLLALYQQIIKTGNAAEVKLWLEYFEGFTERKETRIDGTLGQLLEEIAERKEPLVRPENSRPFDKR